MNYYYRTSESSVVALVKKFDADRIELHKKADEFALLLGENVKALIHSSNHRISFAGVRFPYDAKEELLNLGLWSAGKATESFLRKPLKKVPAALKEQSKALHEIWDKRPQEDVSREPVFNLIGATWGDFVFGGQFSYFLYNDVLYLETTATDKSGWFGEILTSAYASAKTAFEEEGKNAKSK